jgi:NADH-quinone oxidoreductase subunit J
MSNPIPILALLLGAAALWLMLPRGNAGGRGIGMVLGVVALGLAASQLPRLGQWMADGIFFVLAAVTVIAAIGAITFRNPVYCAIWFGLSLLGVAGLFFFVDAQFLGAATVVVYAGAILVTFLFVLMLAQPEGKAMYDRVSWEASLSAVVGMVMVGVLSITIGAAFVSTKPPADLISPPTEEALAENILAPQHVARFGGELFNRHLIAVEIAGTLLLAALVGAAVIVGSVRKQSSGGRGQGLGIRD